MVERNVGVPLYPVRVAFGFSFSSPGQMFVVVVFVYSPEPRSWLVDHNRSCFHGVILYFGHRRLCLANDLVCVLLRERRLNQEVFAGVTRNPLFLRRQLLLREALQSSSGTTYSYLGRTPNSCGQIFPLFCYHEDVMQKNINSRYSGLVINFGW